MDDLISRQAAIDAFKKELTVGESKGNYVTICSAVGYIGAKQILESLPSAQPHWIPVTERLPDKYTTVIVSCVDNSGDTSFSYTDCGYWVGLLPDDDPAWIVDGEVNYHVVAWMELPEPYKEET